MVRALAPLPRLESGVELLDRPGHPDREVQGNLRDLGRLNRLFGGVGGSLRELERLFGRSPQDTLTLLDVGTGGADIPRAICRWGRRRGLAVTVEGVDRSDQVLAAAAEWSRGYPEIRLRRMEAPPLPYADGSFDYAIASLVLHHLTTAQGVRLLREMGRVARRGVIVSDLARCRRASLLTAVGTRLLSRNRLTRHDGPMSVLRGFRPEELRRMAAEAGLRDARASRRPWFRLILVSPSPWMGEGWGEGPGVDWR